MELTKIIIGVVLTAVISSTFLLFISEGVTTYNPESVPSDYADSLNNISAGIRDMSDISNATERDLKNIEGNTNVVQDFLGFFFGNGYRAIKTFVLSIQLTNVIAQEGVENTLGSTPLGNQWILTLGIIITVVIISLLAHFIIKSDRI